MSKLKTSWDLSLVLEDTSKNGIEKLREKVKKESYKFINKWKDRTDYLEDPKVLKEALDEYNNWQTHWSANAKESYYFQLQSSLNQNDPKIKAAKNKAIEFNLKVQNDIQFFELRLSKISEKKQKEFLTYKNTSPYNHFLEKLFIASKHTLSEPEEKIMNLKADPSHSNWVKMTQSFLTKEERRIVTESGRKEVKNFSEIAGLIINPNKKVRDAAAIAMNEILDEHVEVAENEINSVFQNKKINDEVRGYKRPDTARHINDDIETDVVDALVKTVTKHFDIAKRYYKLKAQLLRVPKLHYHERSVDYGRIVKKYSYEDGVKIITKVFNDLDPEFEKIVAKFIEEGRIDVFPKKGKSSGAFCTYNLITLPSYSLLNWTGKLNDILTFAHEMGHGINFELTRKSQNAINFGTTVATTEVASTFMEDFVLRELLKTANEETRLSLMMNKLNDEVSTIIRQVACYNFETELHKEFREIGYLSKEKIGEIFQKNMSSYMGDAVEQSKGSENWWVYWNHIRYFFYVYSYASGLLISKSLQASVKKDPKFILKVKEFLSAGLSDSPKNIFAKLGIDITNKKFWEKGITEVEDLLNETEALANKLKKI